MIAARRVVYLRRLVYLLFHLEVAVVPVGSPARPYLLVAQCLLIQVRPQVPPSLLNLLNQVFLHLHYQVLRVLLSVLDLPQ